MTPRKQGLSRGRYRCADLLKSGNGVTTFRGIDEHSGEQVVLKRVPVAGVGEAQRARLEHEAEVLRRLSDPLGRNHVSLLRDEKFLWLVQPFVAGQTLERRLLDGPLSMSSALRLALDLFGDLERAHDEGVLHRDVKPANVIVDNTEPLDKAVLIDFGFARSASLDLSVRDLGVGSVRYLAPEAAGALERAIDQRSDLYSAGVVLYECLAGRPPFEGDDVGEVLRLHLNRPAPQLRGIGVDVPRALDGVIQRLLRKDPAERYQSAGAVRADLVALTAAIASGVAEPDVVIGLHDRRQALTEPAFVGRSGDLSALLAPIGRATEGKGGVVLVEAESGGGKSRLLDEVALQRQAHAWILRGQAVDQAARRPFQLLEGVVRGILVACQDDPSLVHVLQERLGERAPAAVAALPELGTVLGDASPDKLGPEAYGETRSINALVALLDALGSPSRPAAVLLDDCQWADGPTLKLLAQWHAGVAARGSCVVVVAAFRSEEVALGHPLRNISPVAAIALAPLGPDYLHSLAESMAGPLPDEALDVVSSLSEGSPFMASAVLRGLVESGALVDGADGWEVDRQRLADVQTSRRAALFLVRRLELLAPATLDLLSVGAVLGKDFDLGLAARLSGQATADAATALADAAQRRIVWVDEQSNRARLLHDKLREALLSRLETDERRRLHLRAAESIERLDRDRFFELAYHFDAAGRGRRALPYAIRAAEMARAQHSLDVATAHYRMALGASEEAGDEVRARVSEGLGDVLTLQGFYEEATAILTEAMALATTEFQRASLLGKLGDVAFKRGDQRSARVHLEAAVGQLGRRLPRTRPSLLTALLAEVLVQVAHTVVPRLFVGRRSVEGAERELLVIRLYSRLAYVYWFSAGKVPCAWAHLREMNLAERYGPSAELAQAYSEHAPVMTMIPWFGRGIEYARRSLAIRTDLGDLWGQGQSLNFYGVTLYAASRPVEAIEKLEEAVRLLEQTGDRWEVNTATWNIAFAQYRLGRLTEAEALSRRLYEQADAIGDDTAAGISLSIWSRSSEGRVPSELVKSCMEQRNDDAQTAAEVLVAEGVRLLGLDDLTAAVAVFEQAVGIVRKAGLRQEYVAPVLPWLATALRSQAEAISIYDERRRRIAVRQARRVARRGWRVARHYRNNAPHALRELGLLAAMAGHHWRARRLLERSLAVAESQDARYEQALTRLAMARTDLSAADPDDLRVQAEAEIAGLLPAAPKSEPEPDSSSLSLADRFVTLVDVGRRITLAASPEAVYASVREAAITLLRGEACHVLEVDGPGSSLNTTVSGEVLDQLSHSLVLKALSVGGPVLAENTVGDSTDSVVLSDLRSALCAPIMSDGRPAACLYVTHGSVAGLFGADEIQLTEFITTLAGAALERVASTGARFRSLAQNSSDVITIVDRDLRVVYQTSAVVRVFGFATTELIGRPLGEWLHPDDAASFSEALSRTPEVGDDTQLLECRVRHQDGSWRDVETAINNLVDDPIVAGVILNTRDISDRKQAERDLLATLEREHQIREGLQELDRIKTDFVSSISHELRSPLTSILGYVEMLAEGAGGDVNAEQTRILGVVDRNARRLLVLIEDLLTMSRIESGTFAISMAPVCVADLVEGARQAVLPELIMRDLDVTVDVAAGVDQVMGDLGQLDRVLINLLSNAIKFTPDGGQVSVSAACQDGSVVMSVADTGIGIPSDEMDRVFERFFRSSPSQHLAIPGTGLGLSISRTIVEEHGGSIQVGLRPKGGTVFTVKLPRIL